MSGVGRAMVDAMAADFAVVVAAVAEDSAASAVMVVAVVVDSAVTGATAPLAEIANPATDLLANATASGAMIAAGHVEVETGVTAVDSAGAMTGIAIAVRALSLRPTCRD